MRWYLYTLTNKVDGKIYVGLTSRPRKRLQEHLTGHGSQLVWEAVQVHGEDAFDFEVLVCTDYEHGCHLEQECIKHFGTLAPNGYNLDTGGSIGHQIVTESRETIAAAAKERLADPEARKRHSAARAGRIAGPEERQRLSEAQKARYAANPDHRARHSETMKAFWADPANKARMSLLHEGKPGPRGTTCGRSKLTDDQVREIRTSQLTVKQLAKKFSVGQSTIRTVRLNKTWTHIL